MSWLPWALGGVSILGNLLGGSSSNQDQLKQQPIEYTPEQQAIMQQYAEWLQSQKNPMRMAQDMSQSIADADQFYQHSIEAPAMDMFQNQVIPQIQKQFIGPGTYWGSERAGATRQAGTDFARGLAGQRAETMMGAREGALDRGLQASALHQQGMQGFMGIPATLSYTRKGQPTGLQNMASASQNILASLLAGGYF